MTTGLEALNAIGTGSLAAATGIASGPAGSMLYVGLGATFLLAVAGLIVLFIHKIRG